MLLAERNPDVLALVQASPDAMVVIQNGRHVFANDRALQLYDISDLGELASKPALDYMDPDLAAHARARLVAEERFRSVFIHAPVGMAVLDPTGTVTEVNPALAEIVRCPMDELVGSRVWRWMHPDDRDGSLRRFAQLLDSAAAVATAEIRVVRPDGVIVWAHASTSTLRNSEGAATSFILQLQDVTAHRSAEEQLTHQATRDQLTGLANRALFTARLQDALDAREPGSDGPAVLFLDLDRFKVVNDSLGHSSGDELLIKVAERFRASLRPTDTVARLGGDEFAVLLEHVRGLDEATLAARRLQQCLGSPFDIDGADVYANVSIGIALAAPGSEALGLLRDADAAMNHAKTAGGGKFVAFDETLRAACSKRMELESGLHGALARDELFLLYQPIVETATGAMTGVEALLRWRRADGSIVTPDEFIPVAEETGLIVRIGAWVVREAGRQLRSWRMTNPSAPPLSMAVNVSTRQLLTPELADEVVAVVERIRPDRLTLEITETAAAEVTETELGILERLSRRGVRLAIDDFGTGQSSLARLRTLPVHMLKIDRQFIAGIAVSEGDRSIVLAMIAMADALGLVAVAEGVETPAQAAILRDAGCPLAQGYLFGRPQPPEEIPFPLDRQPQ
jgi:diguanylate cyclase (GGDEF)-like protein/PAS domain S-box-containing protein